MESNPSDKGKQIAQLEPEVNMLAGYILMC
jgi:hypothetical protein